jgi:hypothetical protein
MSGMTFDTEGYALFIRTAADKGYSIGPVSGGLEAPAKSLILRHDVDFSLDRALALAELEQGLGVQATYFIMVSNPFYNALAPRSRRLLARIVELGHEIGLHWDSSTYPTSEEDAALHFCREIELLGAAAGVRIRCASQHIPINTPLFNFDAHIEFEAYSERLMSRYRYVSDSSMVWRGPTPLELLEEGADLYFLAHPIWWTTAGTSQYGKFQYALGEIQARISDEMAEEMDFIHMILATRDEKDRNYKELRSKGQAPAAPE